MQASLTDIEQMHHQRDQAGDCGETAKKKQEKTDFAHRVCRRGGSGLAVNLRDQRSVRLTTRSERLRAIGMTSNAPNSATTLSTP